MTKQHEQKSHLTQNDTHFWVICKHKFLGKFLRGFCHQLFPSKEGHFLWGFTTRRGPIRYFLLLLVLQTKKVRLSIVFHGKKYILPFFIPGSGVWKTKICQKYFHNQMDSYYIQANFPGNTVLLLLYVSNEDLVLLPGSVWQNCI